MFHGTLKHTAEAIVAGGFRSPNVAARLRALAEQYGVESEALKDEVIDFVWQREIRDPDIHFATNPRLAASYARRGSEIDYFGRQAIYRLQQPTPDRQDRSWHRAAEEWAKAKVARTQRPALVEIAVPRHELPHQVLERIVQAEAFPPEIQHLFLGEEILLSPAFASKWVVGTQLVDRCTCWRDGRPCCVCLDWQESPGGWNGTF